MSVQFLSIRSARPALLVLPIAVLAILGGRSTQAQDADPPSAAEVLDRYVEVTGGSEAYDKLNSERLTATIEIVDTAMKGRFESLRKAPDRMVRKDSLGNTGETLRGTDGTIVWEVNPIFGARVLEGVEKAQFLREATFNSSVRWRELYMSVECTGVQNVGGTACNVVVLTPHSGGAETAWYERESGLLRKSAMTVETAVGPMEIELGLDHYQEFSGVKMPTTITMTIMGTEVRTIVEQVEHNVDLPDALFDPPAKVQELIDKAS